jgi:hypothetical protein
MTTTIDIDSRKMSSTEAVKKFLAFYERKTNLDSEYKDLENHLKEMNLALQPFGLKRSSFQASNYKKIDINRKTISIYSGTTTSEITINTFRFFRELRELGGFYAIDLIRNNVRKNLKEYIVPYLQEGTKLQDEVEARFEVPDTEVELQFHFTDELEKFTVSRVIVQNGEVNLLEPRYKDRELSLYLYAQRPFNMIGIRETNGILLAEQFPEIYDFWKIGLDKYEELVQNNKQVLNKMEQIISPFLIANKLGRKNGKDKKSTN